MDKVSVELRERITVVSIQRPEVRNAVDGDTARQLAQAFAAFDANPESDVAVLYGDYGNFCAGADLKAIAGGSGGNALSPDGDGPMGPSRMVLGKPVIAAVAGHAVAGGLELALWCDMRVVERSAVMGVYCRRWGVPLIDGGTVRLPRLIGHSRALDLILTGRGVDADEALQMGLANRVVPDGDALSAALELAQQLSRFPQTCLRSDRLSAYEQWGMSLEDALRNEFERGLTVIDSRETVEGATRFASGKGRHGNFDEI
ncbi:MAG: crotonase/enoyl-CoA hydratase family protein [Halioglobus sp.]|nr:crotonase/enoyl-CoA hydratase family protein [Halioglobus sp.]